MSGCAICGGPLVMGRTTFCRLQCLDVARIRSTTLAGMIAGDAITTDQRTAFEAELTALNSTIAQVIPADDMYGWPWA